jgi:hypothetical protein
MKRANLRGRSRLGVTRLKRQHAHAAIKALFRGQHLVFPITNSCECTSESRHRIGRVKETNFQARQIVTSQLRAELGSSLRCGSGLSGPEQSGWLIYQPGNPSSTPSDIGTLNVCACVGAFVCAFLFSLVHACACSQASERVSVRMCVRTRLRECELASLQVC